MSEITNNNPLLEINTSFSDYLDVRTRTYTNHVIGGGKLDYAFDGDFAMRQKINSISGWSKMYKTITTTDMPNKFKKLFKSSDLASSTVFPTAYKAACICSERMQLGLPQIIIKKAREIPEIYSLAGDGIEPSIVMSADIAEMCTEQELCYLIGCEFGRLQNKHAAFNFAFNYPGINREKISDDEFELDNVSDNKQLAYTLNKWLESADITVDRAGIMCLDNPQDFAKIYASIRKKCIPDSFGEVNTSLKIDEIVKKFEEIHSTPVRSLVIDPSTTQDERRLYAGLEFVNCEVLYCWRTDIDTSSLHLANKQSLEIRCEIISGRNETVSF